MSPVEAWHICWRIAGVKSDDAVLLFHSNISMICAAETMHEKCKNKTTGRPAAVPSPVQTAASEGVGASVEQGGTSCSGFDKVLIGTAGCDAET